jgi:hypothetical protein
LLTPCYKVVNFIRSLSLKGVGANHISTILIGEVIVPEVNLCKLKGINDLSFKSAPFKNVFSDTVTLLHVNANLIVSVVVENSCPSQKTFNLPFPEEVIIPNNTSLGEVPIYNVLKLSTVLLKLTLFTRCKYQVPPSEVVIPLVYKLVIEIPSFSLVTPLLPGVCI